MAAPPPYSSSSSAARRRPTAGDYFGGSSAPQPLYTEEEDRAAIAAGLPIRTARRVSPRLRDKPSQPEQAPPPRPARQAKPTPPPRPTLPPLTCPLCPAASAEIDVVQHLRRRHQGYPFLPSDFTEGSAEVCPACGTVTKPGRAGMATHKTTCKGQTPAMAQRRAGRLVGDRRGRSVLSSVQSTPLRPAMSAPSSATRITPTRPPGIVLGHASSLPPALDTTPRSPPVSSPRNSPEPPRCPTPTSPSLAQTKSQRQNDPHPPHIARDASHLLPLPGSIKHLHPTLARPFVQRASALAEKYNAEPTAENLFDIVSLVKVGLVPEMKNGYDAVRRRLAAFPQVQWPSAPQATPGETRSNVTRAVELVEAGLIGKAERTLNDDAKIAPSTQGTLDALQSKHPRGEDNPFALPLPANAILPTMPADEDVARALKSFKPDTAPGPSGWTVKLITLASGDQHFRAFLSGLTAQMAAGIAVGQDILCSASLTPLLKPDGGVRPIAVGEMFYRLAMKAIFTTNLDSSFLSAHQFGVGTKGGVEPISRAIQYALDNHPGFHFTHLVSLDARNAFNALLRRHLRRAIAKYAPSLLRLAAWSYNTPTPLLTRSLEKIEKILSSEGVRQGDPMGPLFFSIALRDTIEELQRLLGPTYVVMAYLDDIYILAPDDKGLGIAVEFFSRPDSPLALNESKCKQVSLETVRREGFKVLGTCLGSADARRRFLEEKIQGVAKGLDNIHLLPRQHALLILRYSIQQKLRHLLRSLKTDDIPDLWQRLDGHIWSALDRIRGTGPPTATGTRDRDILHLPTHMGGLGLSSHFEYAPLAYKAANALSATVLNPLFPQLDEPASPISQRELCSEANISKQRNLMASLQPAERVMVVEAATQLGRRWLTAIPSAERFRLSCGAVQANLSYRTLQAGYGGRCRQCHVSNTAGHDEWCAGRKDYKVSRHEAVKHHLAAGLRSLPAAEVTVEPFIHDHLNRRNDIRVSMIDTGDRPVMTEEYDIKVVALTAPTHLASLLTNGRTRLERDTVRRLEDEGRWIEDMTCRMEKVTDQQAKRKVANMPRTDGGEGGGSPAPFTPLIFTTGGYMNGETREKLAEWRKWKMPGMAHGWMMTSVAVALAKARGRTFLTG